MKSHLSERTGLSAFLPVAASAVLAALIGAALVVATLLVAASVALASAEDSAEGQPSHGEASAANVVEEGVLHNTVHGFRFPIPKGFELRASSTADEIVLEVPGCDDCVLRVLVSPGN